MKRKRVFVGLSGGVDSSVAAKRLLERGYEVVGVFIKTWHPDFLVCDEERDRLDAMRVAAHLGIPFLAFDAEEEYKRNVADYMIREYKDGRTPNPDVMCNEHVKFGAFLDYALSMGADYIATGHYARIREEGGTHHLLRGADPEKDQSYFLWRLTEHELSHALFPIGDSRKENVRKEAKRAGIPTYKKADSQGICFLGPVELHTFLSHYIDVDEGIVLNESGKPIGVHQGALLYTLGQRHGFTVRDSQQQATPHYVIARDLTSNTITVGENPASLAETPISIHSCNEIGKGFSESMETQFRYRQSPHTVTFKRLEGDRGILTVADPTTERPASGQSCVFYNGEWCLGGGVIT